MSLTLVSSLASQPWWVLWLGVEAVFYVIFRCYIVPRANRHVKPVPYRDYGESCDRYRIMLRILQRTERFAQYWEKAPRGQMALHFREWFHDLDHVRAPSSRIGALTAAFSSVSATKQSAYRPKRWTRESGSGPMKWTVWSPKGTGT